VELLRDLYEAAALDGWLDPDSGSPVADPPTDDQIWYADSRVGYDADLLAGIEREPEGITWFG
jgi:hypothetical protein